MNSHSDRVINFGQVFTRDDVIAQMLKLRRNVGRTLEPSAGAGAFLKYLTDYVAIELDNSVAPEEAKVMDFFDYDDSEKFACVIGNPPYVKYRDILPSTKKLLNGSLFDRRTNLYLYFIEKSIRHLEDGGELIFIVPRDFIKLTSARKLNAWLYSQGTITDFIEMGDSRIFGPFVPNCAIFRFEKGRMDRTMNDGRVFKESHGQLLFLNGNYTVRLGDIFDVRVGAVSGADDVFVHPDGETDFVCSTTIDTKKTRKAFFEVRNSYLEQFKDRLLARKLRKFDDSNWWLWGRKHHVSNARRIYVNAMTRRSEPFFTHECENYDGSILALFPKDPDMDIERAVYLLNTAVDWKDLGFVCDGRFIFHQRSLQNCMLPQAFTELRKLHLTGQPATSKLKVCTGKRVEGSLRRVS